MIEIHGELILAILRGNRVSGFTQAAGRHRLRAGNNEIPVGQLGVQERQRNRTDVGPIWRNSDAAERSGLAAVNAADGSGRTIGT